MKRMLPGKVSNLDYIEDFMDEIRLCSRLHHPNIVQFYGYSWTSLNSLSMLSEYMSRGDLWAILQADAGTKRFGWTIPSGFVMDFEPDSVAKDCDKATVAASFCKENVVVDVVKALVYLHNQGIIHRDLKAKNIMLNHDFCVQVG